MSSSKELLVPKISGTYNENVRFDFIIDDYAIKLFTFKDKDATKLIPSAKQWAFSAEELSDQYKIFFLYDTDDDSPQLNIVLQILRKHANVYQLREGLEYVMKEIS